MKFLKFWFPVVFYSAIIFCVSALPNLKAPHIGLISDKFFHVIEYAPFGFLLARAFRKAGFRLEANENQFILIIVFCSFLYGLSDEIHQIFVTGRTFSWLDMLADCLGGLLGGMINKRCLR